MDWKSEAERLRFVDGLSWVQLADQMQCYFPDLDKQQALEKVRSYIRTTDQYKKPKLNYGGKNKFKYKYDTSMRLYPIGDIHIGAWGFDKKAFIEYINEIANDDKAIVIILGDIIDNATIGSKGNPYSQTITPQLQKEKAIELLYPIRDKILFVCAGNHCERTYKQTGNDIMYDICMGLGVLDRYHPAAGYIKLIVGTATYSIYATHNLGKGEAKLTKMAKSFTGIDLFLAGHIHTPKLIPVTQKVYGGAQIDSMVLIVAAWLKDENYAVSAAYEPCSLKQYIVLLDSNKKKLNVII